MAASLPLDVLCNILGRLRPEERCGASLHAKRFPTTSMAPVPSNATCSSPLRRSGSLFISPALFLSAVQVHLSCAGEQGLARCRRQPTAAAPRSDLKT